MYGGCALGYPFNAGAIAGLMAGLLGVGGGLVIVPALIWVFHGNGFDASLIVHLAVGTDEVVAAERILFRVAAQQTRLQ